MEHRAELGRPSNARTHRLGRHLVWAIAGACLVLVVAAAFAFFIAGRDETSPRSAEAAAVPSGPIILDGANGQVIENLIISNPSGDCVQIKNSSAIVLRNLQIGPCNGRGVYLENASDITIETSTIETGYRPLTCCDLGSGILSFQSTQVTIAGNTLRRNETNVEVVSSAGVTISGNYMEDPLGPFPRGQQVQLVKADRPTSDIVIANNTMRCSSPQLCNQEDAISVYGAVRTSIQGNLIVGGFSPSGCGVLLENDASDVYVGNNHIYDTGNCGIGVAGGKRHVVENNHVLLTQEIPGAGNVAIYVWRISGSCGDVVLRNNLASFVLADGDHNGFWDGGGCQIRAQSNLFGLSALSTLMATRASLLLENLFP